MRYTLALVIVGVAWYIKNQLITRSCRCVPGSNCWPSPEDWSVFNNSVKGHTFPLRPVGWPCSPEGYNQAQCQEVVRQFHNSSWRVQHVAASQLVNWEASATTGERCAIDNEQAPLCQQGRVPSYTVQAQSVEDVQNAVRFAREKNLRLVIRNTGHDLGGRSSGPGALQLDVSGLNNIKPDASFEPHGSPKDSYFLGIPAVTVGGGARMGDVYRLGALEGFTVVGGGSSSVGIAGGFVQTGGMSMFSPSRGLSSDNVLEVELVVANGSVIIANEYQNSDLFWACRGGGGGTFGVVTRMTLRTFPDMSGQVVRLVYEGLSQDPQLWPLVEESLKVARKLNKARDAARLIAMPAGFTGNASLTFEAILLGDIANESQHELEQLKVSLEERSIAVQLHTKMWSSMAKYLAEGLGPDPAGVAMLPVSVLVSTDLMDTSDGVSRVSKTLSGLSFQPGDAVSIDVWCGGHVNSNTAQSAVSPALRSSLMSLTFTRGIPPSDNGAALAGIKTQIESVDLPRLLALEPGRTGISPAFAYPYDNHFADHFWGFHYPRLREIKQRWDPNYVFITRLGVGSEDWDDEGLCRRQRSLKENLHFMGYLLERHGSVALRQLRTLLEATFNVFVSCRLLLGL